MAGNVAHCKDSGFNAQYYKREQQQQQQQPKLTANELETHIKPIQKKQIWILSGIYKDAIFFGNGNDKAKWNA